MQFFSRTVVSLTFMVSATAININVLNGQSFSGPSILEVNGIIHAYSTGNGSAAVGVMSNNNFDDPSTWTTPVESFPQQDSPAQSRHGWARPYSVTGQSVAQLTDYDDSFAMYYAAQVRGGTYLPRCLGLARNTDNPDGPFVDNYTSSFICPENDGGAIDPAAFLDDNGQRYLAYAIDGTFWDGGGPCYNAPANTPIMLQPLQSDGYTFDGEVVEILSPSSVRALGIRAPAIVKESGLYFLFYSSGCYDSDDLRIEYVTAASVYGPYGSPKRLIQSGDYGLYGPGSLDVLPGSYQAAFHSLTESNNGVSARQLNTGQLTFDGDTVVLS